MNAFELPAEKVTAAIEQCRQDPTLRAYYDRAPVGARAFVALQFYLTIFGEDVTDEESEQYQLAVEEGLSLDDLLYLANHDPDKESKAHVRELLDTRMAARRAARKNVAPASDEAQNEKREPEKKPVKLKSVAEVKRERELAEAAAVGLEAVDADEMERAVRETRRAARRLLCVKIGLAFAGVIAVLLAGDFLWGKIQEKRQAAKLAALQERQAIAEAERKAAEAKIAAEKKAAEWRAVEEAKRAAEQAKRERLKMEAEAKAQKAAEEKAEAERLAQERAAAFRKTLESFVGARVDYWKNAPKSERPETTGEPKDYVALVPAEDAFALIEMHKTPGEAMTFREVSTNGMPVVVSAEEFRRRIADTPYFVLSGKKVYFCTAKKKDQIYAVPKNDEPFDPSYEEFGALADVVASQQMDVGRFRYAVSFQPDNELERPIPVCTVDFGQTVSRGEVFAKVDRALRKRIENRAAAKEKSKRAAAKKKAYRRTVVWGDGPRIKKRLDGVTEVPRTCPVEYRDPYRHHVGFGGPTLYRSDRFHRYETRYDEWRALCDEVNRQNVEEAAFNARIANEANETVERREVTEADVNDALDAGGLLFEPLKTKCRRLPSDCLLK